MDKKPKNSKLNKDSNEIQFEMNLLFEYPVERDDLMSISDITLWEYLVNEFPMYVLELEGHISYNTLDDAIKYFKELRDELYKDIKLKNIIEKEVNTVNDKIVYKSIGMTIHRDSCGFWIYLDPPLFYNIYDSCKWLTNAISEIESFNSKTSTKKEGC